MHIRVAVCYSVFDFVIKRGSLSSVGCSFQVLKRM